ncbi:kinase-like domain-containing protein [Lanmaoa asiatica]|nr:kinase-like domain-containing protein [Lanmaoa asiatica]
MGAVCCRPTPVDFEGDVNLFHFILLRCVGKGAFGKVRMVQHKQTRELYALKYINKSKCVKMKAVANIIQERRLLEEVHFIPALPSHPIHLPPVQIDHPFVVNLRYAFQDDDNCFFVLDLMLGGDLRCRSFPLIPLPSSPSSVPTVHLDRLGTLPEETVRFYVAEISSALAFLHESHIMHRDLKPDNLLLDERGHAHLTDFNIAVHYSERRLLTGVAGSMAYMAPEILTKRGYTYTIDWWSLGVCAYELLFGRRPFRGKTNSDLTHSISKDHLRFPEDADKKCSRTGMQVIKGFLDRDPAKRLACKSGEGFDELRRHPWFQPIDWQALESKELPPPFTPDVRSSSLTGTFSQLQLFIHLTPHLQSKKANFDASHELEELLLEDNPLKAKQRKPRDVNSLSAEMRQMEEQFTSYDFKKMQRRTYDPHNQQIVSSITATTSTGGLVSSRPVTPMASDQHAVDIIPAVIDSFEGDNRIRLESTKFSEKAYS